MLTLRQIDYALAVARNLHFKKAAEECFISPSTLSNAITELEAQLGVKIFERSNKKVIVTNLGQEILAKARKIKLTGTLFSVHLGKGCFILWYDMNCLFVHLR